MKKIIAIALTLCTLTLLCSCVKAEEPRGIRTVEINEKGELIVIYTDGTTANAGVVKGEKGDVGEKGVDGVDGQDGKDGKDGANGEDGKDGARGDKGNEGTAGRSIDKVEMGDEGQLVVTYSDGTVSEVSLLGKLYLFGGECGEGASWGFYNGGVLVIGGDGTTDSYSAEATAPWSALIPMIQGVVIDLTGGLTESDGLLYGIDTESVIIERIFDYEVSYIDMIAEAPVYDTPQMDNEIGKLAACTEIGIIERGEGYAKIVYNDGYGYVDIDYIRVGSADSMIYEAPDGFKYLDVKDGGANLRTFPDATGNRTDNIGKTVEANEQLLCEGKSKNGDWYRVRYEGVLYYVYYSVVEEIPLEPSADI